MNEQMQILSGMLEQAQWHHPQDIFNKQLLHFHRLMTHACETVPFYRQHYSQILNEHGNNLQEYPILTREMIQAAGNDFISEAIPALHGRHYPQVTSGSTGKPVNTIATDFTRLFYDALMLREHAWHQRDLSKKLLSIRWEKRGFGDAPSGYVQPTWGPPINQYKNTGTSIFINVASPTNDQIDALLLHEPHYILSYPSQLAALAEECLRKKIHLPFLEEVRTTGETFHTSYHKLIRAAWPHVKITDVYSSVEIGNIAQQCRESGQYHVNAEGVLLEIVNDHHKTCQPLETGRVLVTSLLNYATPLIRYEIGDYAEWGRDCPCGRGLPVIQKIHGRKRNRIHFPNGETRFPYLGEREEVYNITTAIRKFQFVQHTVNDIEIRLVVTSPFTADIEERYKSLMQKNLGHPFNIILTYHAELPAGPTGKFEEFICLR